MVFGISTICGVALGVVFGALFQNIPVGMIFGIVLGAAYALVIHPMLTGKSEL